MSIGAPAVFERKVCAAMKPRGTVTAGLEEEDVPRAVSRRSANAAGATGAFSWLFASMPSARSRSATREASPAERASEGKRTPSTQNVPGLEETAADRHRTGSAPQATRTKRHRRALIAALPPLQGP